VFERSGKYNRSGQTNDLGSLNAIPYFASVEYIDLDFLGGEGRSSVSEGINTASSSVCNASSSFLCKVNEDWRASRLSERFGRTFIVCVFDTV